jgi:hypothetical protein
MTTSLIIYTGNNIERQMIGVDIILIQFPIGQIIKVIYVVYVLTLKKNLLSVNKTTNKRHNNMALCNNHCIIKSKLDENGKPNCFPLPTIKQCISSWCSCGKFNQHI